MQLLRTEVEQRNREAATSKQYMDERNHEAEVLKQHMDHRNREAEAAKQHIVELEGKLQQQSAQIRDLQAQAFEGANSAENDKRLINQLEQQVENLQAVNGNYVSVVGLL